MFFTFSKTALTYNEGIRFYGPHPKPPTGSTHTHRGTYITPFDLSIVLVVSYQRLPFTWYGPQGIVRYRHGHTSIPTPHPSGNIHNTMQPIMTVFAVSYQCLPLTLHGPHRVLQRRHGLTSVPTRPHFGTDTASIGTNTTSLRHQHGLASILIRSYFVTDTASYRYRHGLTSVLTPHPHGNIHNTIQ
jgi:hypothetical protein